jgi:predicted RNA binding protein YcfA (HicA-like mRNA interferase family)
MSVHRRNLIHYLEQNGFFLRRNGKKHDIYSNGKKSIPVKRHATIDNVTANGICRQAGLPAIF